jgi:hypothetical protein
MTTKLQALKLESEKQRQLAELLPDVKSIAETIGEFEFCLNKSKEYMDEEDHGGIQQAPWKLLSQFKWEIRTGLWFCCSLVAAALNTNAARSVTSESIGDMGQWTLAFLISITLVFFVDTFIAKEIKANLARRDACEEKSAVNQMVKNGWGVIEEFRWDGTRQGFNNIQSVDLPKNKISTVVLYIFLALYFTLEFSVAIGKDIRYGNELDMFSAVAPMIGVLLNAMTGYFKGVAIQYPKNRHLLANKYRDKYYSIEKEKDLEREISLINYLTDLFVQNPQLSQAELIRQKHHLQYTRKLKGIQDIYEPKIANFKKAHKQETRTLREEMRQSPSDRTALQLAISESKNEHIDNMIDVLQAFQASLKGLQQQMSAVNLPTDTVEAQISDLAQKESSFQSEQQYMTQKEDKLRFADELKEIRDGFEFDRTQQTEKYQEEIKELKQAIRSSRDNKEAVRLDINYCEENHLGECIRGIQLFQSELRELIHDMEEAGLTADVVENILEDSERQRLSFSGKLERLHQEKTALQFNEQFKQIRDRVSLSLNGFELQWKTDLRQIVEQRKSMVVGQASEASFRINDNECNQKYQTSILKAIEDCVVELKQLKIEMGQASCSTDVVEGFIDKLRDDQHHHEEKLERFREEEMFLRRNIAS